MSRKMLAVAALAFALPMAAAQGQLSFGAALGPTLTNGEMLKDFDMGYHATGILGISLPALPVGLRIEGMFNEFAAKPVGTAPSAGKIRILSATGNATLGVPGMVVLSPYLIGGIGMYKTQMNPTTGPKPESSTDFGINIGAGIKFGLAGFSAFTEARWHTNMGNEENGVKTQGARFIPISFGVTF
jgi:hypothetical protein